MIITYSFYSILFYSFFVFINDLFYLLFSTALLLHFFFFPPSSFLDHYFISFVLFTSFFYLFAIFYQIFQTPARVDSLFPTFLSFIFLHLLVLLTFTPSLKNVVILHTVLHNTFVKVRIVFERVSNAFASNYTSRRSSTTLIEAIKASIKICNLRHEWLSIGEGLVRASHPWALRRPQQF